MVLSFKKLSSNRSGTWGFSPFDDHQKDITAGEISAIEFPRFKISQNPVTTGLLSSN